MELIRFGFKAWKHHTQNNCQLLSLSTKESPYTTAAREWRPIVDWGKGLREPFELALFFGSCFHSILIKRTLHEFFGWRVTNKDITKFPYSFNLHRDDIYNLSTTNHGCCPRVNLTKYVYMRCTGRLLTNQKTS